MPRHWLAGEVPWARPGDGRCCLRQEALCLGRRWPHPFCVAREPLDKAWRAKRQWEEFLPQALLLPRCHLLQEACPGLPGRVGHVPCSWPSITVSPSSLSGRPLSLEAGDCVQALALCPAGALQGSGSWLSMEQMVREPKEVGWWGRERRQGPALPWRTSSGSHSHGHSGSGAHAHVGREGTSRKSLSLTDEMALIPGGEKGPASSPFSQLRCRWPPLAPCDGCTGASRKGDHPFLFPWKLVRSTSAPARPGVPPGEDQQDDLSLKPPGPGWGLHMCLSLFP